MARQELRLNSLIKKYRKQLNFDGHNEIFEIPKTKNKLFIIGTGPSINKLRPCDIDEFKEGVSISVNNFLLHDFEANFCYIEIDKKRVKNFEFYSKILKEKSSDIIYHQELSDDEFKSITKTNLNKKVYVTFCKRYLTLGRFFSKIMLFISFLRGKKHLLVHNCGSVSYLVQLALYLGYKDICLVGVDGQVSGHFFEDFPGKTENHKNISQAYTTSCSDAGVDLSLDKRHKHSLGLITFDEYCRILKFFLRFHPKYKDTKIKYMCPTGCESVCSKYFIRYKNDK